MSDAAQAPLVMYVVSEDWYFWSHRLNLARAARDAGCRVAVATRVNAHADRIRAEGFTLLPVWLERGRVAPLADIRYVLKMISVYRQMRPDLVHHVAMKPVLFGMLAARLAGVPSIVNALAGLGFLFSAGGGRARWLRAAVRLAFRALLNGGRQRVVVQNPDDRDELARLVHAGRVVLVPGSGVDTNRLRPLPEPPADDAVVFAMVSRMLREKGVEDFVAAAQTLCDSGVKVRAVLVGRPDAENPNSCTETELAAWSAEGCVEWWGHCDDIADVWASCHVCVLPSYYREGVPKALLEAAACGRPIITTDTPGCREVVVDNESGVLVPPRQPVALAAAMRRLAADAATRQRMGALGRERAEAVFSEQRVLADMLGLYRELMASRPVASVSTGGTCLVSGAAGFVGRVLCARLASEGYTIRALLRSDAGGPWTAAWNVDLAREMPPDEALSGVELVFHLAARTHAVDDTATADQAYESLNVDGTRRLVDAAARAGVRRVVLFSSVKAMGEGGPERVDENLPAAPTTAYGRTKLAAEEIVLHAADQGGPEGVVLRLPLVYGAGVKGNLARMLDAVAAGRFPSLPQGGARSLVHVEDVAEAALTAAETPAAAGRVYLLTDGEDYSSRRLYELMCHATARTPAAWRIPRALLVAAARGGDVFTRISGRRAPFDGAALDKLLGAALYDDSRARRELGYVLRHCMADALPAMVAARLEAGSAGTGRMGHAGR